MADSTNFAPSSFYFTDPLAFTQGPDQIFGPLSADEYRLTSKFSIATSGTKAYAICTGVALIQPQADDSKVNLIIRPFQQPILGFNIKYFIYRGLDINDFFSSGKVIPATTTTSDFINSINAAFTAFYTSTTPGTTPPDFLASYIGFDPDHQASTLPLSDLFFKQSVYAADGSGDNAETKETAFDLPMIAAGSSLGTFVPGECGLDVVLNYGDYSIPLPNEEFVFDLAYARADEAVINISAETDAFKKKLIQEQIFQFIDVAAYYGFHYRENGVVILKDSDSKTNKTGDQIYTDLLQNFATKNNIYLYIQSDRTRSYNFYGNYLIDETGTNSLKIGQAEDNLTAVDYSTNGWPLLIDSAQQNNSNSRNTMFLQLVTDNNVNTMLYGQVAQIDNDEDNNFFGSDDLQLPPDTDGNPILFTKVIALSNPSTGPDGAKLNVANFNILVYQGQTYDYVAGQTTDSQGNVVNLLAEPDFFDDVFGNLNASPLLKAGDSSYSIVTSQKVKLINHYYNKTQFGISAVQTAVVNDNIATDDDANPTLSRVIYFSETVNILNNTMSVDDTVTADTKSSPSINGGVTANETYTLPEPFTYSLTTFTENGLSIKGPQLLATDGTIPSKIILGMTKEENDLLTGLISTNTLINPRLFLIDLFEDNNDFVSSENVSYQKYKIGLVGETNSGELTLKAPTTDVLIYSLDRKYHFSAGYSKFLPNVAYSSLYFTLQPVS